MVTTKEAAVSANRWGTVEQQPAVTERQGAADPAEITGGPPAQAPGRVTLYARFLIVFQMGRSSQLQFPHWIRQCR